MGGEDGFKDREYVGSSSGANIRLLHSIAKEKEKKFIAIARVGTDGHSFVFNEKPKSSVFTMDDEGCQKVCVDDLKLSCGCADGNCGNLPRAPGEEHLRRWVVYELTDDTAKTTEKASKEEKKKQKKKKKKKQREAAKKSKARKEEKDKSDKKKK